MPFLTAHVGEIASFSAAVLWAISVCVYRAYSHSRSPLALNFVKNTVAVSFLLLTILIVRPDFPARWQIVALLMASGFVGIAIGDTGTFFALRHLGAQVSSTILCLKPAVATFLAFVFLGETINYGEALGIAVTIGAISGIVLLHTAQPKKTQFEQNVLVGLCWVAVSVLGDSCGVVIARFAFQETNIWYGTFLRVFSSQLGLIALVTFYRKWPEIKTTFQNRRELKIMSGTAFLGTFLGILLMTVGLKYTKTGVAVALMITYPIWVLPLAAKYLGEKATWKDILLTLLTCAGVAILVLSKN